MEAYSAGYQAYWDYKTQDDNPYESEAEKDKWVDGFIQARAEDNGDEEYTGGQL